MANTSEPWIWLQEYEASGEADCGCRLDSSGSDASPGAAFYFCPKHAAADDLLEALQRVVEGYDSGENILGPKVAHGIAEARAAIAKAKG